jgi:hypothetical protein
MNTRLQGTIEATAIIDHPIGRAQLENEFPGRSSPKMKRRAPPRAAREIPKVHNSPVSMNVTNTSAPKIRKKLAAARPVHRRTTIGVLPRSMHSSVSAYAPAKSGR